MKPVVDEVLYEGYARCMSTVPTVFRVDEETDVSKVLVDSVDEDLRPAWSVRCDCACGRPSASRSNGS